MQTAPLLVRPSTPADRRAVRDNHTPAVIRVNGTGELEAPDSAEMARRRGVARLLLAKLAGRRQATGARQILVVLGNTVHHRSIGPDRALGLERCGRLRAACSAFGRWREVLLMRRALGADAYSVAQNGAA